MRSSTLALLLIVSSTHAATVVLCNGTAEIVECQVTVGDAAPITLKLAIGESRPINCGRQISVSYTAASGVQRLRLEPYTAYLFVTKNKTGLELMTIQLEGKSPGDQDVPQAAPVVRPLKIPVKLLADNADRRTKALWATELKKRLDRANEVMLRDAGITFESVETESWSSDPNGVDLRGALAVLEKSVKPDPAMVAVGYTSRPFPADKQELPFALSRGFLSSHILIREGDPKSEPERVEVLIQELGRYLGAVASPDPLSVMRPRLGDGQAIHARWRVGFDPLNCLVLNIVAEELRKGPAKKLAEWPAAAQVRLARVYATVHAATPETPMNEEVMALLERAGLRVAEAAPMKDPKAIEEPKPKPAADRALSAEQDAIRKVVKAVVVRAEANSREPAANRVKGDALTELYIRAAADVAYGLENELRKTAFLVGLGIALDDSELVRKMPGLNAVWTAVESDDERKVRLAVLGNPTLRYRRDLCQHFAISAALTAMLGAEAAELVGVGKELKDMTGSSGFSFSDLAADLAGIELARTVQANGEALSPLRQKFTVSDYMPKVDDLPDGLSEAKFKAQFGTTSDPRYKAMLEEIRGRVKGLKAYRTKMDN